MAEGKTNQTKKGFTLDWLMRGALARIGETFDKLTGRNWKPSSSLATSELIERLKILLDAEAKRSGDGKLFVPHNIKLKMQWDKFSADADSSLKKLESELLIAAVDHINDKRYHTFAPMQLEIKPDYFTEGVKLLASFEKFGEEKEEREAAVNVTIPDLKNIQLEIPPAILVEPEKEIYIAEFTVNNKTRKKELAFAERQRLSVGRTKENDLWIDDTSVSKIHAALVLNSDKQLMVADTGSTNGTFINGERIAYGKAIVIKDADKLRFGTVEVKLEHIVKETPPQGIYPTEQNSIEKPTDEFSSSNANGNAAVKTDYSTRVENPEQPATIEEKPTEVEARQTGQIIALDSDGKK